MSLLRERENWLDIYRHILQLIQRLLHRRPDHRKFVEQRFCLVVRAFSLERQQIVSQLSHALFDLRMIDAEPTRSFVELYRALISQIIELKRDAATVRFRNSEAHRAKHT